MFYNAGYQGAAMMFNRSFYNKIFPFFENCLVHDYHLSLVALFISNVSYLDTPLLYYRRHSGSTTKVNSTIYARVNSALLGKPKVFINILVVYLEKFVRYHESQISNNKLFLFNSYIQIYRSINKFERIYIAQKAGFKLRGSRLYLYLKLILFR
jgi:rhamnosyltransferase